MKRCPIVFQGHPSNLKALKIVEFDPNWAFPDCNSSFTNGYGMMHKAWSNMEEVPYCISRSSVQLKVHMAKKINVKFDPNWAFPDCNSSLNSPMAKKWCTKLEVAKERCPNVFQGHKSNCKVTWLKKIIESDPNWAFPDCNSSLNSPMAAIWCTKLEVA